MKDRIVTQAGRMTAAKPYIRLVLRALAIGAALSSTSAHASSNVTTSSTTTSNPFGNVSDADTQPGSNGALTHVSSNSSLGGTVFSSAPPFPAVGSQTGTSHALASATEGQLSAYASAVAQTSPVVQNAIFSSGSARASWSDQLTISAAGRTGQNGTITASISLVGTFGAGVGGRNPLDDPTGDGFARIIGTGLPPADTALLDPVLSGICGGWAHCGRSLEDHAHSFSGSNFPGPTITLTIPITFGQIVTLGYTLDVFARGGASSFSGGNGTSGSGLASYGSALAWDGITSVRDANGIPVLDYSATSASGFDYTAGGVPEPSTPLLLAPGLLGLAALGRRRARR